MSSTRIAIVYHSGRGHTRRQAEAVKAGVEQVEGAEALLLTVEEAQTRWDDLASADAIIFGAPTYMGGASAAFKTFEEATSRAVMSKGFAWKDKLAAGFTNSASQSGDKLATIMQLVVFAGQMGMIWIPGGDPPGNNWSGGSAADINRLGSFLGVMGQSNADQDSTLAPPSSDRESARRHARRVAQIAGRWIGAGTYETERIKAM
jgi:NAD(P)H dehydrogenase (quinone)